jgi:putative flavoprotein involved in K+ transport
MNRLMNATTGTERVHTVVIGGGQAGLTVGYHLRRHGLSFVILDAHERIGDAWRQRWDSLRLFTPARYDGLAGMRFPARGDAFPTKDDMANYLESYAARFALPVRNGVRVDSVVRENGRYTVIAGDLRFEAEHVVVAMGNDQQPRTPSFASELDPGIRQIHSSAYRNPSQLREGDVLVVGLGNSGAEIAKELVGARRTWLSGVVKAQLPFRSESAMGRHVLLRLVRFVGHHVLTVHTPMGRKVRPKLLHRSPPLIRVRSQDLDRAGVTRVPRVIGVKRGRPLLEDGRELDVANVIWCTGFDPAFSWIRLPIFDEAGDPRHTLGVVPDEPGLYFVGLHFLSAMTSGTLVGVGRDAARVVSTIVARTRTTHANGSRPDDRVLASVSAQ